MRRFARVSRQSDNNMAASDFTDTPQATTDHAQRTALTYLYFLRSYPAWFRAAWLDLDDLARHIVTRRLIEAGATQEEIDAAL